MRAQAAIAVTRRRQDGELQRPAHGQLAQRGACGFGIFRRCPLGRAQRQADSFQHRLASAVQFQRAIVPYPHCLHGQNPGIGQTWQQRLGPGRLRQHCRQTENEGAKACAHDMNP